MADDKTKVGKQDRAKVAAGQAYKVQYFAQQYNLKPDQVRDLIHKHGNDCETLEREAKKMR